MNNTVLLKPLNELNGFNFCSEVKVVMAIYRMKMLDMELIQPGHTDCKIEFYLPDEKTKRSIFQMHTGNIMLAGDVDFVEYVMAMDDLSRVNIKAITQWPDY